MIAYVISDGRLVCTENLNADVMVVKSAEQGV